MNKARPSERRFHPVPGSTLLVLAGVMLLVVPLLLFQLTIDDSAVIITRDISSFELAAIGTILFMTTGLALALGGITHYLRQRRSQSEVNGPSSFLSRLSIMLADKDSFRVFSLAAIGYGLFFAFASGTLVYRPGSSFSQMYGVPVPSAVPVLCCGALGQMPQLVIYLTQQLAVLVTPTNLVLLFVISWLVGLNSSIAYFAYEKRTKMPNPKWTAGLGAVLGLFTACPTCAGIFLLTVLGLGGATAISLTLSSLQSMFLATSIPILLGMPVLSTRALSEVEACAVNPKLS